MESKIDSNTRAILVNNVGNPCGNVFSKEHLTDILALAERFSIPIISDDIYEMFVFPGGVEYHSIASLSKNVPILSCSGLTKRFIMPGNRNFRTLFNEFYYEKFAGVRIGWIVVHDASDKLDEVRKGLGRIAGRNFGPSSLIQQALPDILKNTPQKFFDDTISRVHRNALVAYNNLRDVPGILCC
jgi:tyrosine aminotransferase